MVNNLDYQFLRAWGEPFTCGVIRQQPEDFRVTENLSFLPSGEGDHIYLLLEKKGVNTAWVVSQLASLCALKSVDVGYAGLKDRHAVTRQWFSLHMPNQPEPDWSALPESIRLVTKTRHQKKLRIGAIKQNDFDLWIRELTGDQTALEKRLKIIQEKGVPNYFGTQRFGKNNSNVQRFVSLMNKNRRIKRQQSGILISAARSYLFNHILSQRIAAGNWNQMIAGDVLMLDGCRSIFVSDMADESLPARLSDLAVHPTAVLWGKGKAMVSGEAAAFAHQIIEKYPSITEALEKVGASLSHRAMRVKVKNLSWRLEKNHLNLKFSLISGAYATSVLSELLDLRE